MSPLTRKCLLAVSACIAFFSVTPAQKIFLEQQGIVSIEAETVAPGLKWEYRSEADTLTSTAHTTAGASGGGCLLFTGNSEYGGSAYGEMEYRIQITNPGEYGLRLRAMAAPIETNSTSNSNDCYIMVVGQSNGFGTSKRMILDPGNPWEWSWQAKLLWDSFNATYLDPTYQFDAGTHVLVIAGASKHFVLDKIVLFQSGISASEYQIAPPTPIDSSTSATPTRILAPTDSVLMAGQTYTLIGEGENLVWRYDLMDDGVQVVTIGTGDTLTFSAPGGAIPVPLRVSVTGDNGQDTRLYTTQRPGTSVRSLRPATPAAAPRSLRYYGLDGRALGAVNPQDATITARGVMIGTDGHGVRRILSGSIRQ